MAFNNIPAYDATTAGNNTDVNGVSIAEGYPATNINNAMRNMLLQMKQYLANSATVASASTIDFGAQTASYLIITGTTAMTALGTVAAGTWKMVKFTGTPLLTYNATSLILPGAANIQTVAGDTALFVSEGSGNWRCIQYQRSTGLLPVPILTPAISEIGGLLPTTIAGTSTTATLTVTAGSAADSTNVQRLSLGSTSWAVTNGNAANGYQGGATLPNSSTIHFFIMFGTSGTASFASLSATAPTLPSGYTLFRRIFSLKTTAAGALIPGTAIEDAGGAMIFYLTTQVLDINATTTTANRTLAVLSVPLGIKVQPLGRGGLTTATSSGMIFTSPDETDVAPSAGTNSAVPGIDSAANASFNGSPIQPFLTTDTSGQIGHRGTAAVAVGWTTRGWRDFRRS